MHPVPLGESGGSKGQGQGSRRGIARPARSAAKEGWGDRLNWCRRHFTLAWREGGPLRAVWPRADGAAVRVGPLVTAARARERRSRSHGMGCKPMPLTSSLCARDRHPKGRDPPGAWGLYSGLEPGPLGAQHEGGAHHQQEPAPNSRLSQVPYAPPRNQRKAAEIS